MEFGDKSRFAVAFELDTDSGGEWMFGRFCYWIGGKTVGNWGDGVSLRDVLFQMKCIVGDQGNRLCPALFVLSEDKIFQLITTCLDEVSDDIYRLIPPDFLPARLDVCIPVDVFNHWRVFLVDGEHESKLLYGRVDQSKVDVIVLSRGEFDAVFASAYVCLDSIYRAENC